VMLTLSLRHAKQRPPMPNTIPLLSELPEPDLFDGFTATHDEDVNGYTGAALRAYAEAVRAHERERCAQVLLGRAAYQNGPHIVTLEFNRAADILRSGLEWLQYMRTRT